jgi:hypothetical protein
MNSHYRTAVRAFLEYLEVCHENKVDHASLDDCFVGWARWSLRPTDLFATPEAQQACTAVREQKAGKTFKLRCMPVASFVTNLNDTARVYKQFAGTLPVVVTSSLKQFPKLTSFMRPLIARGREQQLSRWQGEPDNKILQEGELLQCVTQVRGGPVIVHCPVSWFIAACHRVCY